MRIGTYQFAPKWWPTLATLILLPVLISLGFWQLSRADEKREILRQQEIKASLPVLQVNASDLPRKTVEYRHLRITGEYQPEFLIYIDNRVNQGRVGYDVVVPLRLADSDKYVLVNRGWIKATQSRSQLPAVVIPKGQQTLTGIAKYDPKDVVSMGSGNRLGEQWPALVRWIDISALTKQTGLTFKPFLFLQDKLPADSLQRDWVFINSPPEKNLSYALQWFSLAAALVLIYFFVNLKKKQE